MNFNYLFNRQDLCAFQFSDDILKLFDQKKAATATFMDIIIFYYLNSNDMASMKLHCNGSIVIYQTVNILSSGT